MQNRFKQRGYNIDTLTTARARAKSLDRKSLCTRKQRTTVSNKIFCSLQFSDQVYKIKNIVLKNWNILSCDPSLGPLFLEPPMFTFRRAPTLREKLVRNHLPPDKPAPFFKKPTGTFKCGSCNHCDHINRANKFMNSSRTQEYKCRSFANCNSSFVVYRLDCACGCYYVGRTKRKLKERFAEHKYAIRTKNIDYPMAKHFRDSGHVNINDLKVMVLEVVEKNIRGGDRLKLLLQRETYWIYTLNSMVFPGLNEELDFSPYLWLFLWCSVRFWYQDFAHCCTFLVKNVLIQEVFAVCHILVINGLQSLCLLCNDDFHDASWLCLLLWHCIFSLFVIFHCL